MARRLAFPKRLRLRSPVDFRRVYDQGRKFRSAHFVLFYAPNEMEHARFGITVSRRQGKAVFRNRLKRILREGIRLNQDEAMCGFDFVFNVHSSAAELSSQKLGEEIRRAYRALAAHAQKQP